MSEKNIKRIHLIYGGVLSVLLVTVAVLFAVMCIDIYNDGANPFTRESISEHFAKISVVVFITLALVITGGIFNTVCPLESKRLKGAADNAVALRRLRSKLSGISPEAGDKIERGRVLRLAMIVASLIFVLFASIGSFIYVSNIFDASSANINAEVGSNWLHIVWFFACPFAYLILTAYVCKRSIAKELEVVKNELKNAKTREEVYEKGENEGTFTKLTNDIDHAIQKVKEPKKWHKHLSLGIKLAVLCIVVVFIIVGVINGGADDVVSKANKICAECIGLG